MDSVFQLAGSWLALNLGLLAAVCLIVWGWLRSRPLTGPELAKKLARETGTDGQKPDLSAGETAFFLRETGRPAEGALLAAMLTKWQAEGLFRCEMAPKKRLSGFGEDMQPTLSFPGFEAKVTGAEGALFALFLDSGEENPGDGTLQASEAYNWVRAHAVEIQRVLLRFEAEGRAALRASGSVRDETKKALFGLAKQERLIYTPRGLRRALVLRQWENFLQEQPEDCLWQAVLLGCGEPPAPLNRFCDTLLQGYTAGLQSRKV